MNQVQAKEKVIRFGQLYGRDALDLACHAAFPLAMTPDLLYCLRENFLIETSWLEVADLLMSSLCGVVGNELYEMDMAVRDVLLRRLAADRRFGEERLQELAKFMGAYLQVQVSDLSKDLGHGLEWVALAYAHRDDVVRLRQEIQKQIAASNGEIRQQIASFLDEQEDLLLAAGLEPLIAETYEKLRTANEFAGFPPLEEFSFEVPTITLDDEPDLPLIETQKVEVATIRFEKALPERYEEILGDGVTLEMMPIPAGEFLMGSPDSDADAYNREKLQHLVEVPSFYLGRYPVTQAQWQAVMGNNPSNFKGDDHPVERVSWHEAAKFCQRLSERAGREYRLPTEAEWEYACRAGTTTKYYFGDDANQLSEYAWYSQNADRKTYPVGQRQPNQFGLYDLHGNVWEWCLDHWHDNYEGAPTDGSAWIDDNKKRLRVRRGGSWSDTPRHCRSAYRYSFTPDARLSSIGFRVICVL